ncbi:hypothetical protein RRG08_045268 [Elysia crispata]|uniref:Uncharacterized protein n=1 Tax=Elysia crispata TaxID=231223 RepID=A0AAE1DQZ8_9GAST|nr:hypothetical protein RRG08_045268 [Elysia crispata]
MKADTSGLSVPRGANEQVCDLGLGRACQQTWSRPVNFRVTIHAGRARLQMTNSFIVISSTRCFSLPETPPCSAHYQTVQFSNCFDAHLMVRRVEKLHFN